VNIKPFDANLSAQYDGPARQAVAEHCNAYLARIGVDKEWHLGPGKKYGIDLVTNNGRLGIEVEVKQAFYLALSAGVDILERKARKAESRFGLEDAFYWLLDKELHRAIVCTAETVAEQKPFEKKCSDRKGGHRTEVVRRIQKNSFKIVSLEHAKR